MRHEGECSRELFARLDTVAIARIKPEAYVNMLPELKTKRSTYVCSEDDKVACVAVGNQRAFK